MTVVSATAFNSTLEELKGMPAHLSAPYFQSFNSTLEELKLSRCPFEVSFQAAFNSTLEELKGYFNVLQLINKRLLIAP